MEWAGVRNGDRMPFGVSGAEIETFFGFVMSLVEAGRASLGSCSSSVTAADMAASKEAPIVIFYPARAGLTQVGMK